MKRARTLDAFLSEFLSEQKAGYEKDYEFEKLNLDIGIQIKEIRTEAKLSQNEFAEELGISPETLADMEAGHSSIDLQTLYEIGRKNGKELTIYFE